MILSRALFRDPLVSLVRYEHPRHQEHADPDEELATLHSVSFIEQGRFDLHQGRRRWRMDRGALFVTHPGMAYRCSHPLPVPDDVCLGVQPSPDLIDDLQATRGRRWRRAAPAAPLTNRLAYLRHRLLESVAGGEAPMAVATLAGELFDAIADDGEGRSAGSGAGDRSRLFRGRQLAWYARRIDETCERLTARYAEPHSLQATAREAGMSPFHFSRVFRELVGVPPHRYLLRVRMARAAERLEQGAGVTETCHAIGFNNLSHFIRSFRRAHGVSPSSFRA